MSSTEVRLSRWLVFTGAAYALGAAALVLRSRGADGFLDAERESPADDEPGVSTSLATAYMATIAALSLSASSDPDSKRELIPPLLVAKAVSSGALFYRFVQTRKRGFAAGAALDAALFGVTAGLYSSLDR